MDRSFPGRGNVGREINNSSRHNLRASEALPRMYTDKDNKQDSDGTIGDSRSGRDRGGPARKSGEELVTFGGSGDWRRQRLKRARVIHQRAEDLKTYDPKAIGKIHVRRF